LGRFYSNQLLIFSGCKFTFGDKGEGRPIPVQPDRSLPKTAARLSLQETSHLERGENGMLHNLHFYYLSRFNPFYFSYSDIIFFRKYTFHSWFYVCCTFFTFLILFKNIKFNFTRSISNLNVLLTNLPITFKN
jgi:hypothetical protein